MTTPLTPLRLHYGRDRGEPQEADYRVAGLILTEPGGSVIRTDGRFVGVHNEFGIVGQAYDRATERLLHGRFLVQWTAIDGEVLHHSYETTT